MKCPFCKAEIKEGSLYCESCGGDIHIVPDFDPVLDDAKKTVSNLSKGVFSGNESDDKKVNIDSTADKRTDGSNISSEPHLVGPEDTSVTGKLLKLPKPVNYGIVAGGFLLILAITVLAILFFTSDGYKMHKADQAFERADYDTAIMLYESLLSDNRDNKEFLTKLGIAYYESGDKEMYVDTYLGMYDNPDFSEDERAAALDVVIKFYDSEKAYDKIAELLKKIDDESVNEKYSMYFVDAPVIDTKDGVYELPQLLVIKAGKGETIKYSVLCTKDGNTESVVEDEVYKGSVLLDNGLYKITAYCENELGIKSDSVSASVEIKILPPIKPEITPASGEYSEPTFIEISNFTEGEMTYYYTTDGSYPTSLSYMYTKPIVMLPGVSEYKFVCINKNGVSSEVVDVKYHFNIEYNVDVTQARDSVLNYLFAKGLTLDPNGLMENGGVIQLELISIIKDFTEDGVSYGYVFDEYIYNESGLVTTLDTKYSVDVCTGEVEKLD